MGTRPFAKKPFQFTIRTLLGLMLAVALLFSACRSYIGWKFPYGPSHCCDKGLMLSLQNYADAHQGCFPVGETTPEASLSLLYPDYIDADTLRGKTVSLETVTNILEGGGRLGPDSCGWHYVEGLTLADDPKLAIFWDKVGLGHNGERLSPHGHYVWFIRWGQEFIPDTEWDEFLKNQEKLLASRPNVTNKPSAALPAQ